MSEYGYIPEAPEQSFGNNKGIFTPKDIYDLTRADKYTNYGQLELIETKTGSSVSAIDFTNLGTYSVHFITYSFDGGASDVSLVGRVSSDGGTSFKDSTYQYANQRGDGEGVFEEPRSTSTHSFGIANKANIATAGHSFTGYMYYYNLLDSSKYSFQTNHSSFSDREAANTVAFNFGSGVYPTAETHNAVRLLPNTSTITGQASIYGIKEYS